MGDRWKVLGAVALSYSISQPGLERGGGPGVFLGCSSPTLPLEEVWPGVEWSQAGGIFILEQHCRGGLVQELSVTAAAGGDLCWLPKLTPGTASTAPGDPGTQLCPLRDRFPPWGVWVPRFEPLQGTGYPLALCAGGEAALVTRGN